MCSGLIAAQTIVTLRRARPNVDVVVVFGAIHTPIEIDRAALDSFAVWSEPSGMTPAAGELRERLSASSPLFHTDDRFHRREHAVEVELPLIQLAWPTASVLAIQTPPNERAVEIGRQTARSVAAAGLRAVYLASSDLTHYGPAYQFSPAGVGISALDWAMENDRRVLQFVTSMRPETIVPEVRRQRNACGAGAIAAMMAACMENGATAARLLRHANSFETLSEFVQQRPDNAVGYAAMVVG
jgi:AmmeMemoRadiSam system protein B